MNSLKTDLFPEYIYIYIYINLFRTSQRTLSGSMPNTSRFMLCILRDSRNAHLNYTVWVKYSVKPPNIKFSVILFRNSVLVTCRQTDRQDKTRRSYECSFATCHGGIAVQCLWRSLHLRKTGSKCRCRPVHSECGSFA